MLSQDGVAESCNLQMKNGTPSLQNQMLCDDAVCDARWTTWYDLLPDNDMNVIREVDDARPPLTYERLRIFMRDETILSQFGVGKTDRVCTMIHNGPNAAVAFLVFPLYCTFAPLNPELSEAEAKFEFEDLPCHTLILEQHNSSGS